VKFAAKLFLLYEKSVQHKKLVKQEQKKTGQKDFLRRRKLW